jgi:hypothetical protein
MNARRSGGGGGVIISETSGTQMVAKERKKILE